MSARVRGPFDPLAMLAVLNRREVRYVVIGGIAAGVQGAMWATTDLDLVYARSREDHARLAAALADLDATPVDLPPGVRVVLDARSLAAGGTWTLDTRHGRLDLLSEPAPGVTYATLSPRARQIEGSERYLVANLADLIVMKEVAGRSKDRAHIELLRATEQEQAALD